jgi:hypothetical protein
MALPYSRRWMMMMPKRTSIILLSTIMVAMAMLFAGGQARAFSLPNGQCTDQEKKNFECFESAGYVVEIVPDASGKFPQIVGNNSVFTYQITKINATKKITLVDVLIPNDCATKLEISASYPDGKLFTDAKGGPITNFGQGLTLDDTWWWNYYGWPPPPNGVQISLTIAGNDVGAEHNAMLLGTATILPHQWGKGEILAPGCRPLGAGALPAEQCTSLYESEAEKLSMNVRRALDSCIIENEVVFYKTSDCIGTGITPNPKCEPPNTEPCWSDPDPGFVYKSGTQGGCPELVEVRTGSPACATLTLKSGRKTTVCY